MRPPRLAATQGSACHFEDPRRPTGATVPLHPGRRFSRRNMLKRQELLERRADSTVTHKRLPSYRRHGFGVTPALPSFPSSSRFMQSSYPTNRRTA